MGCANKSSLFVITMGRLNHVTDQSVTEAISQNDLVNCEIFRNLAYYAPEKVLAMENR